MPALTVTLPWKPPCHWLPTANVAAQVPDTGGTLDGGVLTGGVLDGGVLDGGVLDGGVLDGGVLDGGVLTGGVEPPPPKSTSLQK